MMRERWEQFSNKVDGLSLRERVLIFLAAAAILLMLVNTLFLDPLISKQQELTSQVVQQQEKVKEKQAEIETLMQAQKDVLHSPLYQRLQQARQQLDEGYAWLQGNGERLVPPESMAKLLEQVLRRNHQLQLISLETLPATPLIERKTEDAKSPSTELDRQVFKHGVRISVKGEYGALLTYLEALEKLPAKMFWGRADLKVENYPDSVLTLTLYTLSLDKTWMQI